MARFQMSEPHSLDGLSKRAIPMMSSLSTTRLSFVRLKYGQAFCSASRRRTVRGPIWRCHLEPYTRGEKDLFAGWRLRLIRGAEDKVRRYRGVGRGIILGKEQNHFNPRFFNQLWRFASVVR
jgi:hypothetical protein